jgi:ParB family chromosome partitioning protein
LPRRALGRGLDDLIPGDVLPESQPVLDIPVDQIDPNPYQPRREVAEDGLEELATSIESYGVLQPLIVRKVDDRYQLVAGERRWRAAQRAGLQAVPCVVRGFSEEQSLQVALIENLQREDIDPMEAARAYRVLIETFHLTQAEIAERVGKSRASIANCLRLLNLPESVQKSIIDGRVSEGHGRALLGLLGRDSELLAVWREVEQRGLSVRETERLVRRVLGAREEANGAEAPHRRQDPFLAEAEERIQRALGTRTRIRPRPDGGGTIAVAYRSPDDLTRIVEIFSALSP